MKISAIYEAVSFALRPSGNSQKCPLCMDLLSSEDQLHTCSKCKTVYHRECAEEMGGCSTLGCSEKNALPSDIDGSAWMDELGLHQIERNAIKRMRRWIRRGRGEALPRLGFPKGLHLLTGSFGPMYWEWGWDNVGPSKRNIHLKDLWNLLKTNGESQLEIRHKLRQGPQKPEPEPEPKPKHFGQRMMGRFNKLFGK